MKSNQLKDVVLVLSLVFVGGLIVWLFNVEKVNTTTELNDILIGDVKRLNETTIKLNDMVKKQEAGINAAKEILGFASDMNKIDISVIMQLNARNWQLPEPKKLEQEQEQEQK